MKRVFCILTLFIFSCARHETSEKFYAVVCGLDLAKLLVCGVELNEKSATSLNYRKKVVEDYCSENSYFANKHLREVWIPQKYKNPENIVLITKNYVEGRYFLFFFTFNETFEFSATDITEKPSNSSFDVHSYIKVMEVDSIDKIRTHKPTNN